MTTTKLPREVATVIVVSDKEWNDDVKASAISEALARIDKIASRNNWTLTDGNELDIVRDIPCRIYEVWAFRGINDN